MRIALSACLLASIATAHGGRGTAQPQPAISGPQVFRHGGVDSAPRTLAGSQTEGGWETWWAYNREFIISSRMRGTPISGTRAPSNEPRLDRRKLREGKLYDLMLRALQDKNHLVRSSAAVALGKFQMPQANRHLERHSKFPGEGWFDVREGAIYAMGALRLPENRLGFKVIAGDRERPVKERGLSIVGLGLDGTLDSADLLVWHLNYHRSSLRLNSWQMPTLPEEERRRVAAHMLGFVKDADVNALLFKVAVGSRRWNDGVSGLAVTALGRRGAKDYADSLFKLMAQRETPDAVKRSIPIALGMMLGPESKSDIRRLADFMRDYRRDNIIQHFTAMALAEIGGPQVVDIFEDLINSNVINDDKDRAWLYLALGQIASTSTKAQDILLNRYRNARTDEIRASLALACGIGRVKGAVPITLKLLEKASPPASASPAQGAQAAGPVHQSSKNPASVMAYTLLGLGLHGDDKALPLVRKVFKKNNHPVARHNAAIAIALLRRTEAVPELLEILKETGSQYTKSAVVMALGLMPEATDELVNGLIDAYKDDSNPDDVRALAIIGLGALGDPQPVALSARLTRNYNYHIRSFALDELALLQ